MPDAPSPLATARQRIADAARHAGGLCVLTGAGMSAESGIATFRDARSGLWARFDPMALATEEGFRADPQLVWDWYEHRREGVRAALPNAGHRALAEFERRHPGVLTVVTQNVDDLHQRAGNAGTIRLHGDILRDRWLEPCPLQPACDPAVLDRGRPPTTVAAGQSPTAATPGRPPTAVPAGRPPTCAACGNRLRPGVVWFGEALPAQAFDAAEAAVRRARVVLVVGTSGAVWPAAGLAREAREAGAWVAIVNPGPSEIDDEAHAVLRGTAAGLLPDLLAD
jgi:NAD-dependent deacetylase